MTRRVLQGAGASPGRAAGQVRLLGTLATGDAAVVPEERAGERRRALASLAAAGSQIAELAERLRAQGREEDARLVETGALMADDPELRSAVEEATARGLPAPAAIAESAESAAQAIASIDDATLAARADDVRSLARRAASLAAGEAAGPARDPADTVLVASEVGPADILELDRNIGGIALAAGGVTAHAAIVARSLGIPMVVGAGRDLLKVGDGESVAIDGTAGTVVLDPEREEFAEAAAAIGARSRARERAAANRELPSSTSDGRRVRVLVNAAGAAEVTAGLEAGADGIGLLRTELAFLQSGYWPSEAEHRRALGGVLGALDSGHTATVRLLDLGGDKRPPFLGDEPRRGVDLLLAAPEALDAQLRAILGSAGPVELRLLIPMVRGVEDIRLVRAALARALAAVTGRLPAIGAMIETAEAAAEASAIADNVDFLSIGTNDLTASVLGTDRMASTGVATHDPELLRAIAAIALAGSGAGIPVEVCGEMAGDQRMIPLLVGFGIDELSVGAARVGAVRSWVRGLSYLDAVKLAGRALAADSAAEVSALVDPVAAALELLDEGGNAVGQGLNGRGGVVTFGAQP